VAHGDGTFVAVAKSGTNRVMVSTDNGVSWTAGPASENNPWEAVAFGATGASSTFVAVASGGANRVMTSEDNGASWTAVFAAEQNNQVPCI